MNAEKLTRWIYDALKEQDDVGSNCMTFGDSFEETFLDGTFNLYKVAEVILDKVKEEADAWPTPL